LSIAVPQTLNASESLEGEKTLGGKMGRALTDTPLAGFPKIDDALELYGTTVLDEAVTRGFWSSFIQHCNSLLEDVRRGRFEYASSPSLTIGG
jgi:hypothetical protein